MSRVILLLCALASVTVGRGPFPSSPTRGEIWPKPFSEQKGNDVFFFNYTTDFAFVFRQNVCRLTTQAMSRCYRNMMKIANVVIKGKQRMPKNKQDAWNSDLPKSTLPALDYLDIVLTQPCETYPPPNMTESYNLTIGMGESTLTSSSIWGIMRGLESFSQLFYISDDYTQVLINSTKIFDYPYYSHRGVMVDTSRHYLSMDTMINLLEGMATNKLNVLHWHIVDDQSFPYQSEKFRELSKNGAYYPSLVYNKDDIKNLTENALQRGIRIIPEFDTPGHVTSWALSHPEIMTQCEENGRRPLNPVKNETYDLLRELYKEVQDMFPDQFVHLGGNDVFEKCWTQDPITKQYMKEHQMSTADLLGLHMNNTMKLLKKGSVPVMWEEAAGKTDLSKVVVQITQGRTEMAKRIKLLKVIYSVGWNLGSDFNKRFDDYYKFDLFQIRKDDYLPIIIGGEVCMWGEMVDDTNILSSLFPRASGPAEAMWCGIMNGTVPDEAYNRIEEHTCRMLRRGYPAEPPSGPGSCITVDNIIKPKPNPKPV